MKICILTPRFLFPENGGGDVLKINNIARYMRKKGHELILLSFYDRDIDPKYMEECNDLFDKIYLVKRKKITSLLGAISFFIRRKPFQCGYYYSLKMKNKFKDIINQEKSRLVCFTFVENDSIFGTILFKIKLYIKKLKNIRWIICQKFLL